MDELGIGDVLNGLGFGEDSIPSDRLGIGMDELGIGDVLNGLGFGEDSIPHNREHVIDFTSYLKAINWQEPWLMSLLCFHIIMLIVVVMSRNIVAVQSILGLIMLITFIVSIVYMSETINEFAANNWRRFAGEQYFDTKGFFISTVLSAPLLLNCLIIIINFLLHNWVILKDIQQLKIKQMSKDIKDATKRKQENAKGIKDTTKRKQENAKVSKNEKVE